MGHRIIIASALALSLAACQRYDNNAAAANSSAGNAADNGSAVDALKSTEDGLKAAFAAKDADKVTSYYADDAIVAVPGRTVTGHDAIAKANADDLKDPAWKLDFTNEKTDSSGDLGYTSGHYAVSYTDPKTHKVVNGTGTYLTVYKKQADGSWKAEADFATEGPS